MNRFVVRELPWGVASGKNDENFRNALLQGYAHYKNIGITSMYIVSNQITLLDDFHAMTKLKWKCDFIRKDGSKGNVNFDVIYFTQTLMNEPKIFAYITGDEQAALKSCGLI